MTMVERAIFAAVMILMAGPAWADNDGVAHFPLDCAQWPSQTNGGTLITTPCTMFVGGSGGISTIDQVNKAKALVDDIAEKTKARDALTALTIDKFDISLNNSLYISTCAGYVTGGGGIACHNPAIQVSRQLIIDALQSQIDNDQQKLRAMGIQP